MNIIQGLNDVIGNNMSIEYKIDRIEKLQSLRGRITTQLSADKVQSSGEQDKLGLLTAQILDLVQELMDEVVNSEKMKTDVEKVLSRECNEVEYSILIKRYFMNKSFSRIGREIGYSKTAVYNIHKSCLQRFNMET